MTELQFSLPPITPHFLLWCFGTPHSTEPVSERRSRTPDEAEACRTMGYRFEPSLWRKSQALWGNSPYKVSSCSPELDPPKAIMDLRKLSLVAAIRRPALGATRKSTELAAEGQHCLGKLGDTRKKETSRRWNRYCMSTNAGDPYRQMGLTVRGLHCQEKP
ncbi:hypothetical protein Q8A73_011162 [Channa argus]|nr:hypothetical protein Q8A73_011162 [Channa argus]